MNNISETLEMNHRKGFRENCVSEMLSQSLNTMTRCEAVEPVSILKESCTCSHRVGVASF